MSVPPEKPKYRLIRSRPLVGSAAALALPAALLAALVWLVASGCNDPQAPVDAASAGFHAQYQPSGGGTLEFQLEASSGEVTPFRLIATNLTYDPDTQQLHADVALRNTGDIGLRGPRGVLVSDFTPASVGPVNAESLVCIRAPCPFFFDHRGTYGIEDQLSPGETSMPIEWIFHDPDAASFSFSAMIATEPEPPRAGEISGLVFADHDGNGQPGPGEPGIAGINVVLEGDGVLERTRSDASGRYRFFVAAAGLYRVSVDRNATDVACVPTTPAQLQVVILQRADGTLSSFTDAHFGCRAAVLPDSELVTGVVFDDQNRNGQRDRGEPGVPGIRVSAGSACEVICGGTSTTLTGRDGRYVMVDPAGCCLLDFVQHDVVPGWIDTTPNPVHPPPPVPGQAVVVDFGIAHEDNMPFPDYIIQGSVFLDANANGTREAGEPGVADIELWASGMCFTPVSAHARADARGNYVLNGADVHCFLPWWLSRGSVPGTYDTTPSAVTLTEPPVDGHTYHVDFGVGPAPAPGDSTIPGAPGAP